MTVASLTALALIKGKVCS